MLPIKDGLWDSTVDVLVVGRFRHTVYLREEGRTPKLTFCNGCASPVMLSGEGRHSCVNGCYSSEGN